MWLQLLWSVLTGNLSKVVEVVTGYLGKLSDNDTARFEAQVGANKDVAIAAMQTSANVYHDRVDLLKGMRATQWLLIAALLPPILHQGMVFLDSTPFPFLWYDGVGIHSVGSWKVPKAPAPYDEREWSMIASLLGIQTGLVGISSLLRWLHK